MSAKEIYLGDGLYASFDGWQFCLRAPREHGDHVVYLEPSMLDALNEYAKRLARSPQETGSDAQEAKND
jgi:hypothetical protein